MKQIHNEETDSSWNAYRAVVDIQQQNRKNKGKFNYELKVKSQELKELVGSIFNNKHYINYRVKFIAIKIEAVKNVDLIAAKMNPLYKQLEQFIESNNVEVVRNPKTGHIIYRLRFM
jgi:hypothetical protein